MEMALVHFTNGIYLAKSMVIPHCFDLTVGPAHHIEILSVWATVTLDFLSFLLACSFLVFFDGFFPFLARLLNDGKAYDSVLNLFSLSLKKIFSVG